MPAGTRALLPASRAGLPDSCSMVCVEPPLLARGPSCGLVMRTWFPLTPLLNPPPIPMRLNALVDCAVPLMSLKAPLALLAEMMELFSRGWAVLLVMPPPDPAPFFVPPAPPVALLPVIVLWETVKVAWLAAPPPLADPALDLGLFPP